MSKRQKYRLPQQNEPKRGREFTCRIKLLTEKIQIKITSPEITESFKNVGGGGGGGGAFGNEFLLEQMLDLRYNNCAFLNSTFGIKLGPLHGNMVYNSLKTISQQ